MPEPQNGRGVLFTGGIAAILSAPAWAAVTTVALSVPGMTCATCPITVRTALINATKDAGNPSSVKQ